MTPLLAFHADPAIQKKYLARVDAHRAADEIIQGEGWSGSRGCAVGCTLDAYDHGRYPTELGIPETLAHLEDAIHEGLPLADALDWPGRFLRAPRLGADLSLVWPRYAVWLLTEEAPSPSGALVAALHKRRIDGAEPAIREWTEAARAARAAWWAGSAGSAAAAWEARAAEAAAAARAAEAAGAACYRRQADMLLTLLACAPVPGGGG